MNLLTGLIDIEHSLIYYLDYLCIFKYAQLSKKNNNLLKEHIVYKLLLEFYNSYYSNLIDWASSNGHINILNWLKISGLELKYSENAIDLASRENKIEVLNWWINSGLELKYSKNAINWASENGHIDVLNWWIRHAKADCQSGSGEQSGLELKYSDNAIDWASANNHIEVLNWGLIQD